MRTKTDFIPLLLEAHKLENVDWACVGRYTRQLKSPPKPDTTTKLFADVLIDIIPEKLQIALEAIKVLNSDYQRRLDLINTHISPKDRWFYKELVNEFYKEYSVVSKWINYWLNLWDEIHDKPKLKRIGWISDLDIQKAKDHPIEDLYQGELRKFGNKLSGLCPFHQEKHPSFFIFENNCWHCFGACSTGGDTISFAMKSKNLNFIQAVKLLTYGRT